MSKIHPTAIISPDANIDESVEIGPYCIIESDVNIGKGTTIFNNVRIYSHTDIGENNTIHQGCSLGNIPQDLKFQNEETRLIIGNNNTFREYVTVHRGTKASGKTVITENCFLMNFVHVAHDCYLEKNVIIANCVGLAGHCYVEEFAIIGGIGAIHQFTHIGKHAMCGGFSKMSQDILPFSIYGHQPYQCVGINRIGLKRRGFPQETIEALHSAFLILLDKRYNNSQAIEIITETLPQTEEIQYLINFIKNSKRGVLI